MWKKMCETLSGKRPKDQCRLFGKRRPPRYKQALGIAMDAHHLELIARLVRATFHEILRNLLTSSHSLEFPAIQFIFCLSVCLSLFVSCNNNIPTNLCEDLAEKWTYLTSYFNNNPENSPLLCKRMQNSTTFVFAAVQTCATHCRLLIMLQMSSY